MLSLLNKSTEVFLVKKTRIDYEGIKDRLTGQQGIRKYRKETNNSVF